MSDTNTIVQPTGPVQPPQNPVQNQPAQNQPAQNQPAQNQPAQNQPAQNQPAQNQPAQNQPVPPPTYDAAWLVPVMQEIGLRDQIANVAVPTLPVKPNRPQLPAAAAGKGNTKLPFDGFLRGKAMGSLADRKAVKPENATAIADMRADGLAAPVQLQANGRILKGNFFSAEGHNLKQNAGQPDLARPVVLLLTGSGGSAEDQGLDLAKFYSKSGASVLSVNYGGYGGSTDANGNDMDPTERSLFQDSREMLQHLVDLGYKTEDIVIHGYSMGGAIGGKLKEEMEAGPPIDQSDPPPQGPGNPQPIKFRGAVMDRPLLSMAHGVMADLPPGLGRVAASYSRQALGKFGARGAIGRSANTDTRMVLTSDTDVLGPKAEAFRQRLQGQTAQGRTPVTGAASGGAHDSHSSVITTSGADMKALLTTNRANQPQNVDSGAGPTAVMLSGELLTEINNQINNLRTNTTAVTDKVTEYTANLPTPAGVAYYINKADQALKKALDLQRNMPPSLAPFKVTAKQKAALLQESMVKLMKLHTAAQQAAQGQGGNPPAPMAPPAVLIDALTERCQEALDALAAAGGPAANNLALENDVLARDVDALAMPPNTLPQQLVADLTAARLQIYARHTAVRQAVQQAQAARTQNRARRMGQGPAAVARLRQRLGQGADNG